jgi:hypothetical protein
VTQSYTSLLPFLDDSIPRMSKLRQVSCPSLSFRTYSGGLSQPLTYPAMEAMLSPEPSRHLSSLEPRSPSNFKKRKSGVFGNLPGLIALPPRFIGFVGSAPPSSENLVFDGFATLSSLPTRT